MTFRIRASYVSKLILGFMGVSVAVFTAEFVKVLSGVYGQISSTAGFFSSANVVLYLTIETLFLVCVIAGAFFVVRK